MERRIARLALVVVLLAAPLVGQQASSPPTSAQKLKVEGLPNFGQVSATLFRGGQPKKEGYPKLKEMGVEIVVNLRDDKDDIAEERHIVEQNGMRFVSIPWNAWHDPDDRQVAEFLEFLRANPERKIFVHCKAGKERTGVMIAAYRIAMQGWTAPQALDEMEFFGIRGFWFPHLKKYILSFPERLRSDPDFAAQRPAVQPGR